jgi:hypothetical protein
MKKRIMMAEIRHFGPKNKKPFPFPETGGYLKS